MVIKIRTSGDFGQTSGYNQKEESELICAFNLKGSTIQEFETQMKVHQRLFSGRAQKITGHFILSPPIEDGKKLTTSGWKNMAATFLAKSSLYQQQAIVFLHRDRPHMHIHIVCTLLDPNHLVFRNGNLLALGRQIAEEISTEFGFTKISDKYQASIKKTDEFHNMVVRKVNTVKQELSGELIFNALKFLDLLEGQELKIKRHYKKSLTKQNKLVGYSIFYSDNRFKKSSRIDKEITLKSIHENWKKVKKSKFQIFIEQEKIKDDLESCFAVAQVKKGNLINNYFNEIRMRGYKLDTVRSRFDDTLKGYSVNSFSASQIVPNLTINAIKKLVPKKNRSFSIRPDMRREKKLIEELLFPTDATAIMNRKIQRELMEETLNRICFIHQINKITDLQAHCSKFGIKCEQKNIGDTIYFHKGLFEFKHTDFVGRDLFVKSLGRKKSVFTPTMYTKEDRSGAYEVSNIISYSISKDNVSFDMGKLWPALSIRNIRKCTREKVIYGYDSDRKKFLLKSDEQKRVIEAALLCLLETLREGNPFNVKLFFNKLSYLGFEVETTSNAKEENRSKKYSRLEKDKMLKNGQAKEQHFNFPQIEKNSNIEPSNSMGR